MGEAIRLLIVSSNRLFRESLERVLRKTRDLSVFAAPKVQDEIVELIVSSQINILLLDSFQALADGYETIQQARSVVPDLKLLLVGMDDDERIFLQSIRRGIQGYVLKEASPCDVTIAVRVVAGGEAVCPPRLCHFLFRQVARDATGLPNILARMKWGLTRREQQLLPLIAHGLTNKEIAGQLSLSEQTVKNHIHRILRKVGVEDRLSVLEVWRDQGLSL